MPRLLATFDLVLLVSVTCGNGGVGCQMKIWTVVRQDNAAFAKFDVAFSKFLSTM